ncbi:MAG: tetratricopeptide repeat protein [Planctomycetes bacterium]|nr:tetratricopeptide repeat protein [Planctomycetota bacterium]
MLNIPIVYADAVVADDVPIEQQDSRLATHDPAEEDYTEIDDERFEFLTQTLTTEKQRLEELESEHKKLFDEVVASPSVGQQGFNDNKRELSEKYLLTEPEQDTAASLSKSKAFEQISEIDSKGLESEGNVDLLGTADGLYKLSQYEVALQTYQSIDPEKRSEEDNAWILYQTANCYINLNQVDNALTTYQKLQEKYPNAYPAKEAQWYVEDLNWWKQWHEKIKWLKK